MDGQQGCGSRARLNKDVSCLFCMAFFHPRHFFDVSGDASRPEGGLFLDSEGEENWAVGFVIMGWAEGRCNYTNGMMKVLNYLSVDFISVCDAVMEI